MFVVLRFVSRKCHPCTFSAKLLSTLNVTQKNVKRISDPGFRVVFLGNDNFSLQSLKIITELLYSKDCLSVVVSNANNLIGKYAKSQSLRSILWDDFKSKVNQDNFDIGVVASFGHLIPKRVIEKCEMGILNVHGSLLPKLRGAAPVSRAIINGDNETGVSIMKIAPHRFDVGPILLREKCRIDPHIRAPELTSILAVIGGQALKKALLNLEHATENLDSQVEEEVTLAPKLTSDLGQIYWEQCSASQIYNLFRGLSGTIKIFTFYRDKRIDLDEFGLVFQGEPTESHPKSTNENHVLHENLDFSQFYANPVTISKDSKHHMWKDMYVPGQFFVENNILFVKCISNDWVFIRRVKVGTKWMSAKDFQNGFVSKFKGLQLFSFCLGSTDVQREKQMQSK